MTGLFALWIPIVLSAVIVFIVSSLVHMVLPWHKNDYLKVPNEDRLSEALRPFAIPPGDYIVPRPAGTQEMRSPEFAERVKRGPNLILTVLPPGPFEMTKSLTLWFVYILVNSLFAGYVAGRALPNGAEYLTVFRFAGATAFLGYSLALWQLSIWFGRSWSTTIKGTIDGLLYALLTAGVFGWLWPR